MKIRCLLNRLWLPVSIVLVIACSSRKEKEPVTQPAQKTIEMPKPGVENQQQTDSLKKVIDAERARRRKNQ